LASAISISRSLLQGHAACSAWAQSLPESLLRQSAHSAVLRQSVLASQADQHQRLFVKSAPRAQRHAVMHQ
jgi:hypothetical protein